MKVVVTGGTGFLGKFVVKELKSRGHKVFLIGRDLRDERHCDREFKQCCEYDAAIHLAASCGGIGANQINPASFFVDNIKMGINVIEFSKKYKIKKVVLVGTVCSYPKYTSVPFIESDLWNGYPEETNAPYGIAKKSLLIMLQAYKQQYNMNGIYLIPANLYGPGDNFDLKSSHVIPALIKKFSLAKRMRADIVECWGTGEPTREFLYVSDAARGIIDATERYNEVSPINLGNGVEYKIREVAEMIKDKIGYDGKIRWNTSKPDGQPRRCLNVEAAKNRFGFVAKVDLINGVEETIKWYKQTEGL